MRKTKIICTLGPSTDKDGVLEELVKEGMNVARFNFSHGLHDEQKGRIDKLKEIRTRLGKPVAALLDTKGPEIRIREFENGKITLKEGQEFTLTAEEIVGNENIVSVTYKELYKDVKPGNSILIDDGLIGLEVKKIKGQDIICKVVNGGVLGNKKGVNLPGVEVNMPFISPKDHDDILFGIKEGYDFIAASFTRTAADVKEIRDILEKNGGHDIKIIAKIENQQGVDNIVIANLEEPLFGTFAEDKQSPVGKVDVIRCDGTQLRDSDAGGEKQLDNSSIPERIFTLEIGGSVGVLVIDRR